ncbi:MAG: prephenate/arogenate dehydrogenase family protein, partial [Pseudomonadota bacterium]
MRRDFAVFETVAIIGLGLLGSSLCHAIRGRRQAKRIVGTDTSAETRATAERIELCDAVCADAAEAVSEADLVILCVPVGAMAAVVAEIAPALKPGAVVTDVGSVKAAVIDAVAPLLPSHATLVPAHPIAGTEHSGPEAGFASLFEGRWCIVTPLPATPPETVERVIALWEALGSRVDTMTPEHHDRVLAVTSHLPHLIAYTIVGTADDLEEVTQAEVIKYSAGGFRDFTRIAASDPTMWRDVFLNNREATLELLGRFTEDLVALPPTNSALQRDEIF